MKTDLLTAREAAAIKLREILARDGARVAAAVACALAAQPGVREDFLRLIREDAARRSTESPFPTTNTNNKQP